MFDLTPADFTHIAAQATRFISQLPEAERARYERFLANDESDPPNVQDILMLSANLVRQATGEHQSDLGHDRQRHPLREHVDLDMRPPTVCRMFSREIRATYVLLARRYNPEVLETHRFVQTAANYSVDLPAGPDKSLFSKSRQVAHTYLTVVSYDSRQGIRITPFDPYHSGTELWSNDENGVQALDFSETRGVDSYRQVQNLFRLNDAAHNARGQEDLRIIDESLGLFTSGLNRLSNSLLVSEEVGMREQRATGDSIRELEAHLAYLEQQASDPAPMAGWGLDAEGYIVQRPLTGESLVEYGAQIAQARAEALNSLEAQRRRIAYVEETISGAIADPEAQTPLGLVALSEAADIAVLSGAPVSEATWQQLYAYMVRDETAELVRGMLSTDAAPAGSANALARILEEKFVPPLLADDATFAAWASYKVAYFMTLTRAGVTSWAGGLPGLDTGRFFGLEYEMASGGNPDNVNRALANYGKLISEISFNLHNIGQHDLARRIIARFLP